MIANRDVTGMFIKDRFLFSETLTSRKDCCCPLVLANDCNLCLRLGPGRFASNQQERPLREIRSWMQRKDLRHKVSSLSRQNHRSFVSLHQVRNYKKNISMFAHTALLHRSCSSYLKATVAVGIAHVTRCDGAGHDKRHSDRLMLRCWRINPRHSRGDPRACGWLSHLSQK